MEDLKNKVNDHSNKLIKYSEIESHPIGVKVEIMQGVFTERLPSMFDVIFFKVTQSKGTIIPENFHDCIEEIVVGEGRLLERKTGRYLKQYDKMRIPIGQTHLTEALTDCIWYSHLYLRN